MTALTGTLIGDAVRQGQIEVFVEMGVLRPHEIVGSVGRARVCSAATCT